MKEVGRRGRRSRLNFFLMVAGARCLDSRPVRFAVGLAVGALAVSCGVERVTAVEGAPGAADAAAPESSVVFDAAAFSDAPIADREAVGDSADGELPAEPACAMADAVCISSATTCNVGMYVLYDNHFNCGGATGNTCGMESSYACKNPDETVAFVVDSNQAAGNATVLVYSALQRNFDNTPVSSLHGITATFEETSPPTGIHEDTFEVWLEQQTVLVMVWVDDYGRTPDGTLAMQTTLDGRAYDVWSTKGVTPSKVTFVAGTPFTSGTLDLLQILKFAASQSLIPAAATLGQLEFGVEIASTGGQDATFSFNRVALLTD